MKKLTTLLTCALVVLCSMVVRTNRHVERAQDMTVIRGATLIDGTGGRPRENALVIIRGTAIENVASVGKVQLPEGARVIDGTGKYLMPGLVEAHAHFHNTNGLELTDEERAAALEHNGKAFLYNGVTTILNLSSEIDWALEQRQRAREQRITSPRIFTGGMHFTAPGGWGSRHGGAVVSAQEADDRLNEYFAKGVDLVKVIYENGLGSSSVFPRLDRELLRSIADRCRQQGVPLFIHAIDRNEYRDAVAVSPSVIAHGLADPIASDDPLIKEIVSRNIVITPTLVLFESFYRYLDNPTLLDDPVLKRSMPDFVMDSIRNPERLQKAGNRPNEVLKLDVPEWARKALPVFKQNVKKFADAGVRLTVGTDAGGTAVHSFQGYNTPRELELFVESGLTPLQAIVAGTRNGAYVIGAGDRLGTIEAGKLADMILLNGNPLLDIKQIRNIELVIQGGQVFRRDEFAYSANLRPRS